MVQFTVHFYSTSGAEFFNSDLKKDTPQTLSAAFLLSNSEQKQWHQNENLFPW